MSFVGLEKCIDSLMDSTTIRLETVFDGNAPNTRDDKYGTPLPRFTFPACIEHTAKCVLNGLMQGRRTANRQKFGTNGFDLGLDLLARSWTYREARHNSRTSERFRLRE